ncbi:hypothetical protein IMSAG013_00765 [Clostridiales bacterium]|nr:hypothetical protein [Clostridiales bacterium]GFI55714.1 hypothetical protein IMSAG013_00765 [Clostridiales bacterium]
MKTVSSQKSGWLKCIGVTFLYFVLMLGDLISTYIGTPDLSEESNFLVALFGQGWTEMVIGNFLVSIIIFLLAYYTFVRYKSPVIQCGGLREYVSVIKSSKNKKLSIALAGYISVIAGIAFKVLAVGSNLISHYIPEFYPCLFCLLKVAHTYCNAIHFHTSRGVLHIPVVGLGIIFIIIAMTYHYWFFREYKRNKKALNRLENASV